MICLPVEVMEHHAPCDAGADASTLSIRCDHAKIELQRISQGRNSLRAARILGNDDGISPSLNVASDPFGNDGFGVEVIYRASEEALHLRCVQIDGNDVLNAGHTEKVGEHTGGDGTSMSLLLGLSAVREVWQDSWVRVSGEPEQTGCRRPAKPYL